MAFYSWLAGWIALSQGDAASAYDLEVQSLAHWQDIGDRWRVFWSLAILGRIKAYQGDFAAALAFHEESLARARELKDFWLIAFCLEGWASVVAAQRKEVWAAPQRCAADVAASLYTTRCVDYSERSRLHARNLAHRHLK